MSRSWDDAGFLWFCGCLVGAPVWCVRDLLGFLGAGLIVEYFGFGFCPRCCYFRYLRLNLRCLLVGGR